MRIYCRCGEQLTTDIRVVNEWDESPPDEDGNTEWVLPERSVCITPESYECSPDSILPGIVPEFHDGDGCCNHSHQRIFCPKCDVMIGEANLDCWQPKRIDLCGVKFDLKYFTEFKTGGYRPGELICIMEREDRCVTPMKK